MLSKKATCINFSDEIMSGAIQDQIKRDDEEKMKQNEEKGIYLRNIILYGYMVKTCPYNQI